MQTMDQKLEKFYRYMERYDKMVMANARNYIHKSLAEDVAQETFLKMYLHLDYLNDEKIKHWLLMVSGNIAKNYAKKGGQYTEELMEMEQLMDHIEVFHDSAEKVFEQMNREQAALELLRAACEILYAKDPAWYFALIDAHLLGMTNDQIARVLGIKAGYVAVIKTRAKSFLKKTLGARYHDLF